MSEVAFFILFCVAFVVGLAVLVAWAIWEEVQERRAQRDKRQHLMNEAIQQDITARSRKHNTMREMRDVARDYRRS
jgi:predicted negative regulator of RcsB-dependent stress response